MKKTIAAALVLAAASTSLAALKPMNISEKSSYRLAALVKRGSVPASAATDLTSVQIEEGQFNGQTDAFQVTLKSRSALPDQPNIIQLVFDTAGKVLSEKLDAGRGSASNPIFSPVDGATLLDLASEAVVDHLTEDANLPVVATQAQSIDVVKTSNPNTAQFQIHLKDGRTFQVVLDLDGKFLSRGFLN